ncbi:hypothetical protein [Nocardioides zeae]
MSTTTAATPATPAGDICPPWCGGKHLVDREENTHEDDRGSFHDGNNLDAWEPEGADKALEVRLHGYRHDNGNDWPDTVVAENTSPGFMGGVELQAADARRLGETLIYGAAVIADAIELSVERATPSERSRESEVRPCPWWCAGSDTAHDHYADGGGEAWPFVTPSAFNTGDLRVTAYPTWSESDGTPPDVSLHFDFREPGGEREEREAAMTPDEALTLARQLIRAAYAAKGATR